MLEVHLRHLEHVARVGQEDVAPLAVLGHVLVLALLEGFELGRVVALDPAGLVEAHGFPAALGVVLVLQAVLDDFELELAHGADNLAPVELVDEELGHTFVHQLVDTLGQLLLLHGVGVLDVLEHLRREAGQAAEVELLALGQRVAYLEGAVVRQADDVARPGLVNGSLSLGHELGGAGEAHHLVVAHVVVGRVARELARTYLAEGDTRTVVGVDVGRNLEDEAGELGLVGLHVALLGLDGTGAGGYLDEAIQKLLDTEVVQRRTEEHGSHLGLEVVVDIELGIDALDEFQLATQAIGQVGTDTLVQFLGVDVYGHLLRHHLFGGLEEVEVLLVDVVDALEADAALDGPRQGTHVDVELFLELVQQVEGVLGLAVHLVDEDDDGGIAHAAHFHELACLRLHTLGAVHHDDDAIDGGQRAVGVFGKVLVTGGVEDVDLVVLIVELHDRGGDGDTTLLLDVHPVGRGGFLDFVALDGAGHLYLSAEEQELLGERGLTGIGVRDDRKRSSSFDFLICCHIFSFSGMDYIFQFSIFNFQFSISPSTRPAMPPNEGCRCHRFA